MTYYPMQIMTNTGPAKVDWSGTMIESGESVAALYESYAAEREAADASAGLVINGRIVATFGQRDHADSVHAYAAVAGSLAEELWQRDLNELVSEEEWS